MVEVRFCERCGVSIPEKKAILWYADNGRPGCADCFVDEVISYTPLVRVLNLLPSAVKKYLPWLILSLGCWLLIDGVFIKGSLFIILCGLLLFAFAYGLRYMVRYADDTE